MEVLQIFTEMSWISAGLLCVGFVFLIIETFVAGFGFFGVTGSLSIISGVIVRICEGLDLTQSLALVLIILGFFVICIMIMIFSAQYGILGRSGLFESGSTLSKDYNEAERVIRKLKGKSGKAITDLRMAGKAKIKGRIYDVVATQSFIEKGSNIKVVEIKDNQILVRKWFE